MTDITVIERLRALESGNGVITPDAVVSDAANPESPLHKYFEWDDTEAARKYRIEQARTLIRSVRVEIVEQKHKLSTIAYVRNPEAERNEQGYQSVAKLRTDKDRARKATIEEIQRAEYALQRAYDVAESLGLKKEIEQLISMVRNIKTAA